MTWSDCRTPFSGPRPIEQSAGRAGGFAPSPRRGAPSSFLRRWPRRRRRRGPRGAPSAPPAHYPLPRRHAPQWPLAGGRRRCRVCRPTTVLTSALTLVVPQWLLGAKAPRRRMACLPTLPVAACRSSTTRCRAPPVRQQSLRGRPRELPVCGASCSAPMTAPAELPQRLPPPALRLSALHAHAWVTRPARLSHLPLFVPDGQRRFGTHTFTHPHSHSFDQTTNRSLMRAAGGPRSRGRNGVGPRCARERHLAVAIPAGAQSSARS